MTGYSSRSRTRSAGTDITCFAKRRTFGSVTTATVGAR